MNSGKAAFFRGACLLIAGLLALAAAVQARAGGLEDARRRGKLLVGVKTDFPPFGFVGRDGSLQGVDIEIARYLARALFDGQDRLELVPVTSGSRIPFLFSEWIDIIVATMSVSDERRQVLEFSEPYFITGSLVAVFKDSGVQGVADLAGKRVAVIAGAVQEKDLQQKAPTAKQIRFDKIPEAVAALREKRVDAFCQDDVVILALVKEYPELRAVGKPFMPRPYAVAVRKGEQEFIGWVNRQLAKMKQDGTYEKIWEKYFAEFGSDLIKP
jgi:ABC-type amino acid transport substrate-binding protein